MSAPELSVVVPTHDVGLWLGELLSSILDDQPETLDLEVIVVDDASSDDTREVAQRHADRDPRVRVVASPGTGGGQARNHGASLARGRFLAFADGDDLVPRGAYAAMVAKARETGSDMVVGRFFKFFSDRVWWPVRAWPAFEAERTGVTLDEQPSLVRNRACWNRVFARDFWEREALTFPDATRSNDIVPMVRALLAARIDVVTDTVYMYRDRPGPGSMTARSMSAAGIISYLEQELECARLVQGAGSRALAEEYASLVVGADGWTAIARALGGMSALEGEEAAAELEPAWRLVTELLDVIGRDATAGVLAGARPHVRWGWQLVEARAWAAAAALGGGGRGWEGRPFDDVLDALDAVVGTGLVAPDELAPDLAAALFERPVDQYPAPAEMLCLVEKYRDLLAMAGADERVERLLAALDTDREVAERLLTSYGELVSATSIDVENGRVCARLALADPGAEVEIVLAGDGGVVRPRVRRDPAEPGVVDISVPGVRLGAGVWHLRYTGPSGEGPVSVPGRAVAESSRPGNGSRLGVVYVGGRSRHGVEAGPMPRSLARRAAAKAKRVLRDGARRAAR